MAAAGSPNHGPRRGGARPDLVVIHYTAMATAAAARARLCDPASQVSAHYLVARDGATEALVPESRRAWHAGAGAWGEVADVNSRSIGIELDNPGTCPFPDAQMRALESLLADLRGRHGIVPERVIGHADMAPERKSDPGPRFDWRRLAAAGLSVWPAVVPGGRRGAPAEAGEAADADAVAFRAALRRFGYPSAPDTMLLAAFRARFFPGMRGGLSVEELAAATDLARRFPVDRHGVGA